MQSAHSSFVENLQASSTDLHQPVTEHPSDTPLDQIKPTNPPESTSCTSQETLPRYISHKLIYLASILKIDLEELELWVEDYLVVPRRTLLHFLHQVGKYQLDPISEEILLIKSQEDTYQTIITIDGWCRLINQHPSFAGLTLKESIELKDDIPLWMECSIYRHDRVLPITIKEYFSEIKTEHMLWKTMPRRLLRHRTIQQCARVAFGIYGTDLPTIPKSNIQPTDKFKKDTPIVAKKNQSNSQWLKQYLLETPE